MKSHSKTKFNKPAMDQPMNVILHTDKELTVPLSPGLWTRLRKKNVN